MFRKIPLLFVMAVCIAALALTTGCSAQKNKEQTSSTYKNLKNQIQVFNEIVNSSDAVLLKEDHKLYYRSAKESWPSSIRGPEPYPYDEPYYSQHKGIVEADRACISELIELQAIILKNTLSSVINKKVTYVTSYDEIKNRINKVRTTKGTTPNLIMCQLLAFALDVQAGKPFLEIAASGQTIDKDSLAKFLQTKNNSDLKMRMLAYNEIKKIEQMIKTKEFRKQQMYKLFNPRSFGN